MRIRHFYAQTPWHKYQCCGDFEITRYAQKSTSDVSTIESKSQSSESGAFLKFKDFSRRGRNSRSFKSLENAIFDFKGF